MIKKNILTSPILLLTLSFLVACQVEPNENCEYGFKKAVIVYGGAPEVDGCGWTILIDSVYYHPVNLSQQYEIADLPVLIKYLDDPTEFRCGRGGVRYPSIRISEIKLNAPAVGILGENDWEKYSMDPFRMDSAYVDGDLLYLHVGYSGGCRDHELNLWRLPPNALEPPPVELALSHDANGDMCEAYITRWLVFSLVPIRERGKTEVRFLLRGSPEMSAYFGEYIYKY